MPRRIKNMGTATMRFNEGIIVSGSIDTNYASKAGVAIVVTGSLEVSADGTDSQAIRVISNDSQREMVFDSVSTSGGGSAQAAQLLGNGSKGLRIDAGNLPQNGNYFKIDTGTEYTFQFKGSSNTNRPGSATQININASTDPAVTVDRIVAAINGDASFNNDSVFYNGGLVANRPTNITAAENGSFTNGITLTANATGTGGNVFFLFTNTNRLSVVQNSNQLFTGGSASGGGSSTSQETIASIFTETDDDLVISGSKEVHIRSGEGKAVMILSGTTGGAGSPNPSNFTDTNFFVSGTIGSKGTNTKGTAVFGGDVVISGTLNGNAVTFSTPGGSDGQVQYNNGGSLGGATNLFYNDSNDRVGIGTTSPDFRLDVAGNIGINEKLVHNGDHDTFISYQSDVLSMSAGGVEFVTLEENSSQPSNFFVNKNFSNVDFSIMGQGQQNMDLFYVDASVGNVGFGTSEPEEGYNVHISGSAATYLLIGEGSGNQKSTSAAATIFHADRGNESVTGSVGVTSPLGGIGKMIVGTDSRHDLEFRTFGNTRLYVSASGGIGAGYPPNESLTVNGTISFVHSGMTPNVDTGFGKLYVPTANSRSIFFRNDEGTEYDLTLGASVAAGDDSNLLYNNGGAIGGANRLYYDDVNHRLGIKSSSPSETLDVNGNITTSGKFIFTSQESITVDAGSSYQNQKILAVSHAGFGQSYGTSLINRGTSSGNPLLLSSSADIVLDVGSLGSSEDRISFKKDGTLRGEINVTNTDIALSSSFGLKIRTQNNKDLELFAGRNVVLKHSPSAGGHYTGFTFDVSDTENGTAEIRSPHDLTISNLLGAEKNITIDSDKDFIVKADRDMIVNCNNVVRMVVSGSSQPMLIRGGSDVDTGADTGVLAVLNSSSDYLALDNNTVQAKTATGDSATLFINSQGSGNVSITNTGKVGIGTSSPSGAKLHVSGSVTNEFTLKVQNTTTDTVLLATFVNDNRSTTADGIGISIGPNLTSNMTTNNKFIKFRDGTGDDVGFIQATNAGSLSLTEAFTGFHPVGIASGEYELGSIVETSGEMWVKILTDVSDSFPYVNLCTTSNSKKVFGVICCTSWNDGKNPWASITSRNPIKENYQLAQCNSIGEGAIIVTNINGDIENGDYITSSDIAGYGQKQSDDILHNYTVAKCIEDIDWDNITDTVEYNDNVYKKCLVACTYHCG